MGCYNSTDGAWLPDITRQSWALGWGEAHFHARLPPVYPTALSLRGNRSLALDSHGVRGKQADRALCVSGPQKLSVRALVSHCPVCGILTKWKALEVSFKIILFKMYLSFLVALDLLLHVGLLSPVSTSRNTLWLWCVCFSLRGLLWLQSMGSRAQGQQLWCTGLVAPRHVGFFHQG